MNRYDKLLNKETKKLIKKEKVLFPNAKVGSFIYYRKIVRSLALLRAYSDKLKQSVKFKTKKY